MESELSKDAINIFKYFIVIGGVVAYVLEEVDVILVVVGGLFLLFKSG